MIPSFFKILFFGRYIENGFSERYSQLRRFGDFVLFKECNPVNNKVLLYSIGDYIQYPEINHNGKEYKKEYICIYIYDLTTLLYSRNQHNIVNQLYFN